VAAVVQERSAEEILWCQPKALVVLVAMDEAYEEAAQKIDLLAEGCQKLKVQV
jgi:hypothetical protein